MGDVKLRAGLDGLAAARALRFEMRMRGQGPAVGDTAKAKLRDTLRRRRAEESAWDHDKPRDLDHGDFQRDALPVTQGVPVRHLAARTGLWMGYCALYQASTADPKSAIVGGTEEGAVTTSERWRQQANRNRPLAAGRTCPSRAPTPRPTKGQIWDSPETAPTAIVFFGCRP